MSTTRPKSPQAVAQLDLTLDEGAVESLQEEVFLMEGAASPPPRGHGATTYPEEAAQVPWRSSMKPQPAAKVTPVFLRDSLHSAYNADTPLLATPQAPVTRQPRTRTSVQPQRPIASERQVSPPTGQVPQPSTAVIGGAVQDQLQWSVHRHRVSSGEA